MPRYTSPRDTYEVVREHARGGFGVTYIVESARSHETLLLKELTLDRVDDWKSMELFEREATVLEGLDHPGIPRYVDYFQVEGGKGFALVQELLDGETYADQLAHGTSKPAATFVAELRACLEILVYLHGRVPPVVHRDITPKNILVAHGEVHLIDFGAVKVDQRSESTTVGTFGYMAPEQLLGKATPASDLYGLGMTFVAMAGGAEVTSLPMDTATGRVDVAKIVGSLPLEVRHVLGAMTDPEPATRLGSAREALDILAGRLPVPRGVSAVKGRADGSPPRRSKGKWIFLAVLLLVLGGVLGYGWVNSHAVGEHEYATIGGWGSGHAKLVPAITGAVTGDFDLVSRPNDDLAVAFGANGITLASASEEGLLLWKVGTKETYARQDNPSHDDLAYINAMEYSPDGAHLAVVFSSIGTIYDAATGEALDTWDLHDISHEVLGDPKASLMALRLHGHDDLTLVLYLDETLYVVKREGMTSTLWKTIKDVGKYHDHRVALSEDATILAFTVADDYQVSSKGETLLVYSLDPLKKLRSFFDAKGYAGFALSPGGDKVIGVDDELVTIYDLATWGTKPTTIPSIDEYAGTRPVAVSKSGTYLVVGAGKGAHLFDLTQGKKIRSFYGHMDDVVSVAISSDDAFVATAAEDQLVKVWDTGLSSK